jgi:acyl-CoA thioesterase FadM
MENNKPDANVLKRFMKEFFPFSEFKKVGLFTAEMKNDYEAQAKKICNYFGYTTVYEYGAKEINCHITYVDGKRPINEPFITTIPSIYD